MVMSRLWQMVPQLLLHLRQLLPLSQLVFLPRVMLMTLICPMTTTSMKQTKNIIPTQLLLMNRLQLMIECPSVMVRVWMTTKRRRREISPLPSVRRRIFPLPIKRKRLLKETSMGHQLQMTTTFLCLPKEMLLKLMIHLPAMGAKAMP